MAVCVFIEISENNISKTTYNLLSYAKYLADREKTKLVAVNFSDLDLKSCSEYGVDELVNIKGYDFDFFQPKMLKACLEQFLKTRAFPYFILGATTVSKYIGTVISGYLQGAMVTNVIDYPKSFDPFVLKHLAFTNKAYAYTEIRSETKVISLNPNAIAPVKSSAKNELKVFDMSLSLESPTENPITLVEKEAPSNKISIQDADVVVSGGRGLKGPENFDLIDTLAHLLNAATACSRPVSDSGWRPQSEHVGQTGKPVSSNLYIAIGISGAIQHLAGVNASKVKFVINSDPDAPFFKSADYGIVGDALDVVPRLIEKIKEFKNKKRI